MKHLFASCAVIALMAVPAPAQSTYDFAAPLPDAEAIPEQTAPEDMTQTDEIARAYEPETGISADTETVEAPAGVAELLEK